MRVQQQVLPQPPSGAPLGPVLIILPQGLFIDGRIGQILELQPQAPLMRLQTETLPPQLPIISLSDGLVNKPLARAKKPRDHRLLIYQSYHNKHQANNRQV